MKYSGIDVYWLLSTHAVLGLIILEGSLRKHHILNANAMRGGADYVVYVNTAGEFDGYDSGALPDEAFTWGKLSLDATPVKLFAEASLVFPLIARQTFFKEEQYFKNKNGHWLLLCNVKV